MVSFVSCNIDKGFGGALVDLKNKVLKECDDFFIWKEDSLGHGDEHEFWSTEELDEQGSENSLIFWFGNFVLILIHFVAFAVIFSSAVTTVDSFFGEVDSLNTSLLLATQRLAKIAENSGNDNTEVDETTDRGRVKTTAALLSTF